VVVRDTTGGGGEQNLSSVFEGSQALPVCPSGKCKLLTSTIEIFIYLFILLALRGVNGLR
jgi:hypothetical protein